MFSLARALPSPISAEECSSLFDRFTGTTARSDSSETLRSAVRRLAFSGRSRSRFGREVPEVSRFSCMLFLSVRGFLDYAEPADHSRYRGQPYCLPPLRMGSASLIDPFRSSIARPTDTLVYASTAPSRTPPQDSGSRWSRFSFLVGLFHPLQHAGLSRRTRRQDSNLQPYLPTTARQRSQSWSW